MNDKQFNFTTIEHTDLDEDRGVSVEIWDKMNVVLR